MARTALMTTDGDTIDPLATYEPITVKARNLRPGMLVLDDLGTAVACIDHRNPARRGTGEARFLVEDLERGGWIETAWHANTDVTVAAR